MMHFFEFILAVVALVGGTLFLLSPVMIVKAVLQHREKMASLRFGAEGSPALLEEMQRLRQEVAELRETTTRFDMSFDAGLARVEDRLTTVEQETLHNRYTQNVEERVSVGLRS
jgi:hypothetical protein